MQTQTLADARAVPPPGSSKAPVQEDVHRNDDRQHQMEKHLEGQVSTRHTKMEGRRSQIPPLHVKVAGDTHTHTLPPPEECPSPSLQAPSSLLPSSKATSRTILGSGVAGRAGN